MNNLNLKNGLIGLLSVIMGFIAKSVYRPYANQQHINDFGFADSAPSFFYVIGFSQLLLIKNNTKPKILIILVTMGSVGYEVFQSRHQILDISDIFASLLGGLISFFIWSGINKNSSGNS